MKRILSVVISLAAALALSACASLFTPPAGTQLQGTWDGPPSQPIAHHIWEQDTPANVKARCSFHYERDNMACTIRLIGHPDGPRCLIISNLTEGEAQRTWFHTITGAPSETVWEHEVRRHCNDGLNHRTQPTTR